MKKCSLLIQCTFEDAILVFDRVRYHQGLLNSYLDDFKVRLLTICMILTE